MTAANPAPPLDLTSTAVRALMLHDLIDAVAYLRARGEWEKMSGLWREIVAEIARRRGE